MSTQIQHYKKTIEGELYVNQFGSKKHGLSLQFTVVGRCCPQTNSAYVQMTRIQVRTLVRDLQDWLGENELFQRPSGNPFEPPRVQHVPFAKRSGHYTRQHKRVGVGYCPICKHYGSDCTGIIDNDEGVLSDDY